MKPILGGVSEIVSEPINYLVAEGECPSLPFPGLVRAHISGDTCCSSLGVYLI